MENEERKREREGGKEKSKENLITYFEKIRNPFRAVNRSSIK